MKKGFDTTIEEGKRAEDAVRRWMVKEKGYTAAPDYKKKKGYEGPRIHTPEEDLIAPDKLFFRGTSILSPMWVEVKSKESCTVYRKTLRWQIGIDRVYYDDYLKVEKVTPWPVHLYFFVLFEDGAINTPAEFKDKSPTGLFVESLRFLKHKVDHPSPTFGKGGMVFWNYDDLQCIASTEEILKYYV